MIYYDFDQEDYYDNIGGGYGGGRAYRGSYSWADYYRGYTLEEDPEDVDLVVKEAIGYLTPTRQAVRRKLPYELSQGGYYGGQETDMESAVIPVVKNLSRFFYHQMMDDQDVWNPKYIDDSKNDEGIIKQKQFYDEIFKNLEGKFIPGHTPVDKAIWLLRKMAKDNPPSGGEDFIDKFPDFTDVVHAKESDYYDPGLGKLTKANDYAKDRELNIMDNISIVGDWGDRFRVEKEIDQRVVHNSRIRATLRLEAFEQLPHVSIYQHLMPNFDVKLATKDLNMEVPVERKARKQKIIILIDRSGSMANNFKQEWVCSIMMDRLRYVMQEECEIFFSFFLHTIESLHFTHVYDHDTAVDFWAKFCTQPGGGDTNLGMIVQYINSQINNKNQLHNLEEVNLKGERVEILAINDGQDSIKTKNFAYKTNAISLYAKNDELRDLCLKNKGKYVYIDPSGKMKEYE